jgi:hypothetical protein
MKTPPFFFSPPPPPPPRFTQCCFWVTGFFVFALFGRIDLPIYVSPLYGHALQREISQRISGAQGCGAYSSCNMQNCIHIMQVLMLHHMMIQTYISCTYIVVYT